jgi:hypothetical protein
MKQIEKYGVLAWCNEEMDLLRSRECLCLNCNIMQKCDTAKILYYIARNSNIAMMITRCPAWKVQR